MFCKEPIYKILGILASVLLIQCCLGNPLEENVLKLELPTWPANITEENMNEYFANHTIKASRQILNDASVIANHNKEVEDFKLNLTTIINRYEKINDELKNHHNVDQNNATIKYEESVNEIMEHFLNVAEYYYELPEEKKINDSKFISDILTKYDGYYVYKTLKALVHVIGEALGRVLTERLGRREIHKQDIMVSKIIIKGEFFYLLIKPKS